MNILYFIEALTFLVVLVACVTQVILPILAGRPMFPMFRKRAKLEEKIVAMGEKKDESELEKQLRRMKNGNRRG